MGRDEVAHLHMFCTCVDAKVVFDQSYDHLEVIASAPTRVKGQQ